MITEHGITNLECRHNYIAYMCKLCYALILFKDEQQGDTDFLPYLVSFCRSSLNLQLLKKKYTYVYDFLIKKHPELLVEQEPSVSEENKPSSSEPIKESTPQTELNSVKNKPILDSDNKFKFSASCKCQHNIEMTKCKNCNPINLDELKKSKCLHLIPIIECNHCKNLILILRKEKDRTRVKFIQDKDYIPYTEYDKLYNLNPNPKKNNTYSNSKKRKTDPELDDILKEKNQKKKIEGEGNKKDTDIPPGNNNNKRDFKILESQEEMELEQNEQEIDKTELNEKIRNDDTARKFESEEKPEQEKKEDKVNYKKPPPIFITNEDPESVRELLIGYEIKEYTLKKVSDKQVKVILKTEVDYRKFLQKLHDMEVKFYTFQFPSCKTTKRILRGLPSDYEIDKIKSKFKDMATDLELKNIRQIYHIVTKTPLPLFELSFKLQSKISERLEKIKNMDNFEISLEKIDPKFIEIPICKICLNYGHTKRFCSMGITCIICTGSHFSSECPISLKAKEDNKKVTPICLHCKESHFTTWKGCNYYKKLRKAKLEKFRKQKEFGKGEHPVCENGTPKNVNNPDGIEIKKLNNQLKSLEEKFEKEISLLNKTIDLLKNEIINLNGKLKSGNTQMKTK
nr:PREDICTED: nucleic-acid-binding protein from mobile element jockey-like [Bemisia tabaci]